MSEPFVGRIQMFGFNFPPRSWAQCNGQTLPISQNTALFSLLGTIYGGDGRTTFTLPDLRGRSAVHFGQGPGLPNYNIGQSGGANDRTLNANNLPPHSHGFEIDCNAGEGETDNPQGQVPSVSNEDVYAATPDQKMRLMTTQDTGNGQSFNVQDPYLAINFCIALQGSFPSRS